LKRPPPPRPPHRWSWPILTARRSAWTSGNTALITGYQFLLIVTAVLYRLAFITGHTHMLTGEQNGGDVRGCRWGVEHAPR
jgi:hypothetical protein